MSRPKKKEIGLNKESILSLLQEIYNELVEQRSTAIRVQNKMLSLLKDPEDMTVIGPVLEKQQKIINDVVEKKLTLAKLQSSIWEKSSNKEDDNMSLCYFFRPEGNEKRQWSTSEQREPILNIIWILSCIFTVSHAKRQFQFKCKIQDQF